MAELNSSPALTATSTDPMSTTPTRQASSDTVTTAITNASSASDAKSTTSSKRTISSSTSTSSKKDKRLLRKISRVFTSRKQKDEDEESDSDERDRSQALRERMKALVEPFGPVYLSSEYEGVWVIM